MGAPVSGGAMQVMHIDSIENLQVTTGGVTTFTAPQTVAAMFSASVDCWVGQGNNPTPSGSTGFFVAAGVVLPLQFVGKGAEPFYAIAATTTGRGTLASLS